MKILLRILAVVFLIVVVAAVGLVYFIRSGDHKATIEQAVADTTGYQLTIAGDLSVDFLPRLGITLSDVRLRNPGQSQELLSTSEVVLRVNLSQLLSGNLQVEELLADNFHLNYYVNADGSSIWDVAGATDSGSEDGPGSGSSDNSGIAGLTFDRISINNTSIDYQDLSAGSRYQVDNFNLETRDTNLAGRPFDLQIDFDFENNGMSEAVPVSLRSNIIVDINNGNVNFNNFAMTVTPLLLQGEISLVNFDSNPQFTGNLRAEPFDMRALLERLALVAEADRDGAPGLNSDQFASFQMEFSGNTSEATVPGLTVTLGETSIDANGSVRFASGINPMNVSYSIIGGDIDLTPYLGGGDEEAEPPAPADPEADTPLPIEALSGLNLLGSVSLASVTLNDMRFADINLYTNIEDSVLDIELAPVTAFNGTAQGALRLDAQASTPELTSQFSVNAMNLAQLAPMISRFNSVTGNLNLEADYSARGTTVNTMMNSLAGTTSFAVTDNSVDIGLIKQVFTAIAALSPTGESIQQWPDEIRFSEMGGFIVLEEGLSTSQEIKLRMDNFDITGSGGVNLAAGTFDYDMLFTVLGEPYTQTIPVSERFRDISWPVRCEAAFSDAVSQYCGPDFEQVRQIFAQIGTNAVRSRLNEVIEDQVPDNLRDGARGLLNNLFDRGNRGN